MKRISFSLHVFILVTLICFSSQVSSSLLQNIERETKNCFGGGGCDLYWAANKRFDEGIESKAEAAGRGLNKELKKAANYIFDKKLTPFVKDLEIMLGDKIISAEKAMKVIIDNIEKSTNTIINNADKKAKDIIKIASEEVDNQRKNFFADVSKTWKRVGTDIDCIASKREEYINNLRETFSFSFLDFFRPKRQTLCQKELNLNPAQSEHFDETDLFALWKCEVLSKNNKDTSSSKRRTRYGLIQKRASKMICFASLADDAPTLREFYLMHWLEASKNAEIWRRASGL